MVKGAFAEVHLSSPPKRFVSSNLMNSDLARTIASSLGASGEVVEASVSDSSKTIDKKIHEIDWPEGSGLIALFRGQRAMVPAADDVIQSGDMLVAMVSNKAKKAFSRVVF